MNNPLPHKLQVRNSARKLAAAIDVLRTTPQEIALLTQHFPKARISSLADYQGMLKPAVDQIDAGREPHVVMRMELEMDMHPFLEVLDVHAESTSTPAGDRCTVPACMVSTKRGDALLPLDTMLVWSLIVSKRVLPVDLERKVLDEHKRVVAAVAEAPQPTTERLKGNCGWRKGSSTPYPSYGSWPTGGRERLIKRVSRSRTTPSGDASSSGGT